MAEQALESITRSPALPLRSLLVRTGFGPSVPFVLFLRSLILLIVNRANNGMHHVVQGTTWRKRAVTKDVSVRVLVDLRGDAGQ